MWTNRQHKVERVQGEELPLPLQLTPTPSPTPTPTPTPIPDQVREKELTHLREGLLTTVIKWGKVALRP